MDEIEFIGAMGHQQLIAQRRAKNLEKMLAAAEQRGYERGEEHGYACGWKQAMVAVENNGCSKLGMITIPISLLRLLSDKYLKEEGKK